MKTLLQEYLQATGALLIILLTLGFLLGSPIAYIGIGGYFAYTALGWLGVALLVIIGVFLFPLWLIVSQRIVTRLVS